MTEQLFVSLAFGYPRTNGRIVFPWHAVNRGITFKKKYEKSAVLVQVLQNTQNFVFMHWLAKKCTDIHKARAVPLYYLLINLFAWRRSCWRCRRDLSFRCIQRLRVYTEKSDHSWEISRYTTRKHCISSIYFFYFLTLDVLFWKTNNTKRQIFLCFNPVMRMKPLYLLKVVEPFED